MTRSRNTSPTSSVMCRKFRRLRLALIFYTCGSLCAILLLLNFNEDVKKLLQQSQYTGAPHEPIIEPLIGPRDIFPIGKSQQQHQQQQQQFHQTLQQQQQQQQQTQLQHLLVPTRKDINFLAVDSSDRSYQPAAERQLLWFMAHGTVYPHSLPSPRAPAKLWPEENPTSDRIVEQLMYTLEDFGGAGSQNVSGVTGGAGADKQHYYQQGLTNRWSNSNAYAVDTNELGPLHEGGSVTAVASTHNNNLSSSKPEKVKIKTILLYYGLSLTWGVQISAGRQFFLQQKCPVNACRLTGQRPNLPKSDVVVFKDVFMNPKVRRPSNQLWVMYMLECPLNTQNFLDKNVFNLTATYRHDSDIVTPYEKWVYYDDNVRRLPQSVNFAEGKTKKVAWFVSNCVAKNNRLEFAHELGKHIQVDIYGACGSHSCSRANAKQCFDLLSKHYKFYLAFENSNCRDYISEKFFVNGLGNNVLPIVMGAHPDDYKRVAPEKSYIHVDDFASPKELAQYLLTLDASDELYNEYFEWKGTGEFVNTHFFCRLCAMAHYADRAERKTRSYEDFNKWWRGPNVCTRRSWRNQPDIFSPNYSDRHSTNNGDNV